VSPHWSSILVLLLLILVANALPAALGLLLGPARPVDGGRTLGDGRPLLGPSKTWRGIAAALIGTTGAALALGLDWWLGLAAAGGAMLGDLGASFVKRRLGRPSSASVPLLDQVPESLLPGVLTRTELGLDWGDLGVTVLVFVLLDLLLTPLGRRLLGRGGPLRRASARES
jgi:CDP-2,3-bis-(O-geranylgeranyl)-sn-glycerol synthase